MKLETIKPNTDLEDYFSKMTPEDSAAITTMCINRLACKVKELKDLYSSLAKTYGFEMGACGITMLVQVSSPLLPNAPVCGLFGTDEGIEHALKEISKHGAEKNG